MTLEVLGIEGNGQLSSALSTALSDRITTASPGWSTPVAPADASVVDTPQSASQRTLSLDTSYPGVHRCVSESALRE